MDIATLTIILALVAVITSGALFLNWMGNSHIPGLLPIACGHAITSLGAILWVTNTAPAAVSVLLANALLLGGRLPVLAGLCQFWNQERSRLPLMVALLYAVALFAVFYLTFVHDSLAWRIGLYTVMMLVFYASSIAVLVSGFRIERKLRPVTAISSHFGAILLVTLFGFNGLSELATLFLRADQELGNVQAGTSLLLVTSILSMIIFAFAITIMTMEELNVEYKEDAIYDPITTILNYRTFLEVGQRVMGVALRYSQPVSMICIEVSNFDDIVNTHGTAAGNEFLRHFALAATNRRRNEDILARTGYKEFRMLLPGVDEEGAAIVIAKIKAAVAEEEYRYKSTGLGCDLTLASATRREEGLNLSELLQEGDIALLKARQLD